MTKLTPNPGVIRSVRCLCLALMAMLAATACERPEDHRPAVAEERPVSRGDVVLTPRPPEIEEPAGAGMDRDLSRHVRSALREDPAMAGLTQHVEVTALTDGTVVLRGMVNTERERQLIEQGIEAIDEVQRVDNRIAVIE